MARLAASGGLCDREEWPRARARSCQGGLCSGRGDTARLPLPYAPACEGPGTGACSTHPLSTDEIGNDRRDREGTLGGTGQGVPP